MRYHLILALTGLAATVTPPAVRAQSLTVETNLLVARSGASMASAPLEVVLRDANGARMGGKEVQVTMPGSLVAVQNGTVTTGANGVARFADLKVSGPVGQYQVAIRADTLRAMVPLDLRPGDPVRLEILTQPPLRSLHDSVLSPAVRTLALDAAGNPVPGARITVELCHRPEYGQRLSGSRADRVAKRALADSGAFGCRSKLEPLTLRRLPIGTTVATTDALGIAEWDDLMIRGDRGQYKLRFTAAADTSLVQDSDVVTYDPADAFNRSYVVISAIKTIAGEQPANEFFALRFRFNLRKRPGSLSLLPSALAGIDLALTNRNSDSVSGPQKSLTEAFVHVNLLSLHTMSSILDVPQRNFALGPQFRVFNGVPYFGMQLWAMELGGSVFHGSSLSGGVLWGLSEKATVDDAEVAVPVRSLFADFHIGSTSVDFFKTLHVRGGVLFPLEGSTRELQSRITISIPVGTLAPF